MGRLPGSADFRTVFRFFARTPTKPTSSPNSLDWAMRCRTTSKCGYHLSLMARRATRILIMPGRRRAFVVEIANGLIRPAWAGPLDFLHLPVPQDRSDAAYFAPLRHLRLPVETMLVSGPDPSRRSGWRPGASPPPAGGRSLVRRRHRVRLGARRPGPYSRLARRAPARDGTLMPVALITGGARGIGYAMRIAAAEAGRPGTSSRRTAIRS